MQIEHCTILGAAVIYPPVFSDNRGIFVKPFVADYFAENKLCSTIGETFYSKSHRNVIRGMHFCVPPFDSSKLVTVLCGAMRDVILDLRVDSPTYGNTFTVELSAGNHRSLYVPTGCAHGFLSLCDDTVTLYQTGGAYSASHDRTIRWDSFAYDWGVDYPIISDKDKSGIPFCEFKSPFLMERR